MQRGFLWAAEGKEIAEHSQEESYIEALKTMF
jgi:hypothetical protein